MKILITGGVGFIGVNTAVCFLQKGWIVTVLDNFSRRGVELNAAFLEQAFPGRVKTVRADVRSDFPVLQKLMDEHDVVVHLAAQVAVTTSVTQPREDFEINALGTLNILEAVRLSERRPIVLFASTNKVYGGLEDIEVIEQDRQYAFADGRSGVTEEQSLDFHSPYGCSKGAADQYVRDYARLYDLQTVVFRQSCIYGPHQFGIEDQGWVAWFMIAGMLKRPVQIYGNGKQVRDLLYVDDVVRCYVAAIEKIDVARGRIYNLGGGRENTLSLLTFLQYLRDELGVDMSPSFSAVRPGDQPLFISDNAKAEKELGWKPIVSIKQGIPLLWEWLQENRAQIEGFYR